MQMNINVRMDIMKEYACTSHTMGGLSPGRAGKIILLTCVVNGDVEVDLNGIVGRRLQHKRGRADIRKWVLIELECKT